MNYKGRVETWFPGLGVWNGSNSVFTSWIIGESPNKGTSNGVYYILGQLYNIKKEDDIWRQWCDGEIQILIEPTMWMTFNKDGPAKYTNDAGRQVVVYGSAKNIANAAIKKGIGGEAGGGWLQDYLNNILPRNLTLDRKEKYFWHTPPQPSGSNWIDVYEIVQGYNGYGMGVWDRQEGDTLLGETTATHDATEYGGTATPSPGPAPEMPDGGGGGNGRPITIVKIYETIKTTT